MTFALVYWTDDHKTSIVDILAIPEQNRHAGHMTEVLWGDGNAYSAQVIKIGSK